MNGIRTRTRMPNEERKDRRMFERYQAVYLYTQGKTRKEIATIIRRNEQTVSQYIRAYQTLTACK